MVNFVNLADIDRAVQSAQINDMNIQNAQLAQQDRLRNIQAQEQAAQNQMRIRDIYSQTGGDLKATRDKLYQGGFYEQGQALDKQIGDTRKQSADISKSELDTAKTRIGILGNATRILMDNPSKPFAMQIFGQMRSAGVLDDNQYNDFTANLPDDPNQIRQGAEVLFRSALDAKDQLEKFETRDTGGRVDTFAINPVTGRPREVSSIVKTQSPDSIASNQRIMQEGALNRQVQLRGQNLTDARAREKNATDAAAMGYSTKPLPATALKMQNESLDKLAIANNNNKKLGQVLEQIDTGKLKLGLVSNIEGQARNYIGRSTESSRNLSSFKSTLEKLRNDSLRLNTGVQTDGDAQRAWNELFENINDQELVKQRLAEIQEINKRGAELQKLQIENIRGNYNVAPIDFSKYEMGNTGGASGSFDVRSEADKILGL